MLEKAQKNVKTPIHGGLNSPVWPTAASQMNINVTVNALGEICILHDRHFPDYLEWVEFDSESRMLTFITAEGKLQDLGLTIHPPMDQLVKQAKTVCVVLIRNGQLRDVGIVPLMVR